MNQLSIGQNIQRARLYKGIKQEFLAKQLKVSRVMVSRYENGHSEISLKQLEKISSILRVEIGELLHQDS